MARRPGPPSHPPLDDVSKAIIEQLQEDGRRSCPAIGKAIGLSEAAVRQLVGRRPFVLSRASFIGVGAYAAHWTGDNGGTRAGAAGRCVA